MPVVGEAIIVVRVISDRLAADIKDAVKRGMAQAAPDIDSEGEAAGRRMAAGVSRGVRRSRDTAGKEVGKEIELWPTRFISGSGGVFDRAGKKLGERLADSITDGVKGRVTKSRGLIDKEVSKALVVRSNSDLVKVETAGNDIARRYMGAISQGITQNQGDLWSDVRKSFNMRPGDIDAAGHVAAADFSNAVEREFTIRGRRFRDNGEKWANSISAGLGRGFRGMRGKISGFLQDDVLRGVDLGLNSRLDRVGNNIGNSFTRGFNRARTAGQSFFSTMSTGFTRLRTLARLSGNQVGTGFNNGVNRGASGSRGSLLGLFAGIGADVAKSFNLGIGSAKMGQGIISLIATIAPSLLAGAAALGTALATEIITAMAALGPGIGGAIGVGLAAVSSLGLNFGLLMLAFKASGTILDAVKKDFAEMGKLIGTPIAQGMLTGLQESVGILSEALPQLNEMLTLTGEAFGRAAKGIAETIASTANMARIKGILATNITFIDNFKDALSGLTTSFLILFNASKPFVDFIGEGAKRYFEWAAASLAVSEANGNLGRWMDGMLASFKDLWAIVKNFSRGIGNLFKAAGPAGESLLSSIRGIAERFRAWTSDTSNMARMTAFFDKARILASKVWEVLGAIFTAGGRAFEGMDLGPILHVLDVLKDTVAPAIARIFNQIQKAVGSKLVTVFDNIGKTFTKIADSRVIEVVAGAVASLLVVLSEFFASDFGAMIAGLGLAFVLFGGVFRAILTPIVAVGRALVVLRGPALLLAGVIGTVVSVFLLAYANSEKFRTALSDLWTTLKDRVGPILEPIGEAFGRLGEAIGRLGEGIGNVLAPIIENVLTPILVVLGNVLGGTILVITEALTGLANLINGLLGNGWQPLMDQMSRLGELISGWWEDFKNWFGPAWDTFWSDTVPKAWENFTTAFGDAWDNFWGNVLPTAWDAFKTRFEQSWTNFWDVALPGVWEDFKTQVAEDWNTFWDTDFEGIWNDFTTTFSNEWTEFWNTDLPSMWDTFTETISSGWNQLWSIDIKSVWETFKSTFSDNWDTFWNTDVPNLFNSEDGVFAKIGERFGELAEQAWEFALEKVEWVINHFWQDFVPMAWEKGTKWLSETTTTFWTWLGEQIGKLGEKGGEKLDDFWQMVKDWFGNLVSDISTGWDEWWSTTLPDYIGGLVDGGKSELDKFPGMVETWFQGVIAGIGQAWSDFWSTDMPNSLGDLTTNGKAGLDGFGTMVSTWFEGIKTGIGVAWDEFWDTTLPNAIAALNTNAQTHINGFLPMIHAWWDGVVADVTAAWNDFWGISVPGTVDQVGPAVTGKLDSFAGSVDSWISTFFTNLGNDWNEFWGTTLPNWVSGLWSGTSTELSGFDADVNGWFDRFTAWLESAWDTFWSETLPNLVQGLITGASEKLESLKGIVSAKLEEVKNGAVSKIQELVNAVLRVLNPANWTFPDFSGVLQSNLVQPFVDTFNDITRVLGEITGATQALNFARDALGLAQAEVNAVAVRAPIQGPPILATPRPGQVPQGILDAVGRGLQAMIPSFAKGGIIAPTPGGALIRVAEAGRPERVDPIQRNGLTARDEALIRMLTGQFSGGGGNDVNVNVSLGERSLEAFVTSVIKRNDSANARRVGRVRAT